MLMEIKLRLMRHTPFLRSWRGYLETSGD